MILIAAIASGQFIETKAMCVKSLDTGGLDTHPSISLDCSLPISVKIKKFRLHDNA